MVKKKQKKQRVDELLVQRGLCLSVKEAQALVYADKVYTNNRKLKKPSEILAEDAYLGLKSPESTFVSRGGDKLYGALKQLELLEKLDNTIALDVGSSTGGFTDCLLKNGVKQVTAVDVGSNQLAWSLRKNPKVISIEKTHIKDLKDSDKKDFDLIVADISFNSLESLAPYIACASKKKNFSLLLLVKPQFELPKASIPKGGVVTNSLDQEQAIKQAIYSFENLGFSFVTKIQSPIKGRTGNSETFIYLRK